MPGDDDGLTPPRPAAPVPASRVPPARGNPPVRAGTVAVVLSGHIDIDGQPCNPGDVVHVSPDLAASLRWSGYAPPAADDRAGAA